MTLQAVALVGPPEVTVADGAQGRNLPELPATIPALSDRRFGPNAAQRPGGRTARCPRLQATAATRSGVQIRTAG